MALTTQCPFCQTAFRVANDQLKIRGGLVRCGACNKVFNAQEHLLEQEAASATAAPATAPVELAKPAPVPLQQTTGQQALPEPAPAPSPQTPVNDPPVSTPTEVVEAEELRGRVPKRESVEFIDFVEVGRQQPPDDEICLDLDIPGELRPAVAAMTEDDQAAQSSQEHSETPTELDTDRAAETVAEAKADADAGTKAEAGSGPEPAAESDTESQAESAVEDASETPDDFDEPGFIKRARRLQRNARITRMAMGLGSVLLLIGALAQGAYTFRNQLAVSVPQLKPYLTDGCALLGCRIDLPGRIDAISVEAIELQQSALQKDALILTLLLRNRSSGLQAWPHIELTLNDTNEKTIVRRVFTPAEYLPARPLADRGFNAASEQPVRLVFEVAQLKPSGYVAQVFYP